MISTTLPTQPVKSVKSYFGSAPIIKFSGQDAQGTDKLTDTVTEDNKTSPVARLLRGIAATLFALTGVGVFAASTHSVVTNWDEHNARFDLLGDDYSPYGMVKSGTFLDQPAVIHPEDRDVNTQPMDQYFESVIDEAFTFDKTYSGEEYRTMQNQVERVKEIYYDNSTQINALAHKYNDRQEIPAPQQVMDDLLEILEPSLTDEELEAVTSENTDVLFDKLLNVSAIDNVVFEAGGMMSILLSTIMMSMTLVIASIIAPSSPRSEGDEALH